MNTAPLACLVIALMATSSAAAQTERRSTQIWRCGPEGRELRDAPCPAAPQASGRRLDYDSPSERQREQAREVAQRDARLATELQQARQRFEAQAQPGAAGIQGRGRPGEPPLPAASAPAAADKPLSTKKPRTKKPRPPKAETRPGSG